MAEQYCQEHEGVNIEVYYSSDTVAAHLSTRYASGGPYTLSMTDAKDIYTVGRTYGADLTGEEWTEDTDYAISVDGKVIGFPVCIETRGMLYNADAIERVTGEPFDKESIKTLDDFDAFLQKLVDAGMEKPTDILKPDWSLAAHYLQQVYEEHEDVQGFIDQLYAGEADLINDEKFNSLMDVFDVLKKYNYFAGNEMSAEDELVHMNLSEGEVAFQFGGCWEWNDIIDYEYTGNIGIMPIPQNIEDAFTGCIVGGGSKFFFLDESEYTSDEQRAAAKDFLNWLALSDEGKVFVADTCGMVSPFASNTVACINDIGRAVKEYADAGKMVPNYDYDPDDHYSVLGAVMQKYLTGKIDRTELASEIENYWTGAKRVEH